MITDLRKPSSSGDTRYAYLVGRVRALEVSLLTQKTLENLLRSENLDQALRGVAEIPYWGEVFQNISPRIYDIDKVLMTHYWQTIQEINSHPPGDKIARFFIWPFDFNEMKLILKYRIAGKTLEEAYPTTLDVVRVNRFLGGETREYLPDLWVKAITDSLEAYENYRVIQAVEMVLDRHYLEQTYFLAQNIESKVLKNWLLAFVLLAYLRAVFRARYQERKGELVRLLFFPQPLFPEGKLIEMLNASPEKVAEEVSNFGFDFLLPEKGIFRNDPSYLAEIERNMDNYLLDFIRSYRWKAFGPEPVFGFLWAQNMDVKNLRLVLEGKYFGLENEKIKNKLRECYYE
ncbi:MAG: V/A-type H+/Na+-transporting ATPase subunit [Candidatus Atribacteria bacterium]|nr:V/A-type H+/Na+-transporting ATPase subunit [Candidatus Atribacteria bacterium]